MVSRSPMIAKAMTPVNIHALGHNTDTKPQPHMEHQSTRPPNMPKAGSAPKASMFDGCYGGKKPQG